MRPAALLFFLLSTRAWPAVELDAEFWENYDPYEQYTTETLRELIALQEGDLLETGRDITGVEIRVVGRSAPAAPLVSARAVVDSSIGRRLQVKRIPYSLSPNTDGRPELTRRLLTGEQAEGLLALLDETGFWDAPYSLTGAGDASGADGQPNPGSGAQAICHESGHWIVEGVRPGMYQLSKATSCDGDDTMIIEIRDYLLGIAGMPVVSSP